MTSSTLPPPYRLADALDAARFGAKAANLARLHRSGIPAVEGVALDAAWLDAHLAQGEGTQLLRQLRERMDENAGEAQLIICAERLVAWILATPLTAQMREHLRSVLDGSESDAWVVRSSALGEDSANASFAGQLESVLHCHTLEDVEQALKRVWASGFTAHCLSYQRHCGQQLQGVGVVVCRQLEAAFAGVMFSSLAAPSGEQGVLIEYTQGLADGLVAGTVTPAQAWFGRVEGELRSHESNGCAPISSVTLSELEQ